MKNYAFLGCSSLITSKGILLLLLDITDSYTIPNIMLGIVIIINCIIIIVVDDKLYQQDLEEIE